MVNFLGVVGLSNAGGDGSTNGGGELITHMVLSYLLIVCMQANVTRQLTVLDYDMYWQLGIRMETAQ